MNRRHLLRGIAGASLSAGGVAAAAASARAGAPNALRAMPRMLVNLMLRGGLDSRFVFMPTPDHDARYVDALWNARADLYDEDYPSYEAMFDAEYLAASDPRGGGEFGIHRSCGWLHREFGDGNVAVIANTFGTRSRGHDQAQLNVDIADPDYAMVNSNLDGWGGRLVEAMGGDARCIELGSRVSPFSHGMDPNDRLIRVVHARDTRDMAMPMPDSRRPDHSRNMLARAMRSYYQLRGAEVARTRPADWPYHRFFDHFEAFESLGTGIAERIGQLGPRSTAFDNDAAGSSDWRQQCANLHDLAVLHDLMGARCLSMQHGKFDTHKSQQPQLSALLSTIFGADGGLAVAMREIAGLGDAGQQALDQMVFNVATDFGRQFQVNGSEGTDHGHGLYTIVVGRAVNGGTYGEMFPAAEANEDDDGRVPLDTDGADIAGKTSTERVVAALCEWASPGSGTRVAVNAAVSPVETPGLLDDLMPG